MKLNRWTLLAALAALLHFGTALAQQPIRIVVPFPPGGATDTYNRMIAAELTPIVGPVIVENKPGGGAIIGAEYVLKQPADGRTLFMGSNSSLVNNTVLYAKLPYDPQKDFASVSHIGYQPQIIVARTDLPFKNIQEMIAYAKANPGKLNRGSAGTTNINNLSGELFGKAAGINITHIPFNGEAPALQAMLGGTLEMTVTAITGPTPHIKAGKMRVLVVMDSKRLPEAPDVPTAKEIGVDLEAASWYCLVAPAGSPAAQLDRMNAAINQVLTRPDMVQKVLALGVIPRAGSREDLDRFIKAEFQRWVPILKGMNIKPEGA